ncbi:MAG: hypothetical protein HPY54_07810 [Chthonomonadetes bacterium]|nr:hypothetical protein [Chthonomonadetes bacterium]
MKRLLALMIVAVAVALTGCGKKQQFGDKPEDWKKTEPPPDYLRAIAPATGGQSLQGAPNAPAGNAHQTPPVPAPSGGTQRMPTAPPPSGR